MRHFPWLFICLFYFLPHLPAQGIRVQIDDNRACFFEGLDSVLCYQIKPISMNGQYERSNYIHPLYTLDGMVLTEDFPRDHPHHRGIFWAWHQLLVGNNRIGDGWATHDFNWDVTSVKQVDTSRGEKAIEMEVLWKSPNWIDVHGTEKALVQESTTIRVFAASPNYRLVDVDIGLLALEPNIRLGGSEDEKGYGGFSPRIRLPADVIFTSEKGKVRPDNLPVKAGAWMDISGALGSAGSKAGLTILCHPSNPGFPQPWILRASGSMQNAVYPFPGAQPVTLSTSDPTVLQYRLIIHDGTAGDVDIPALFDHYATSKR